MFWGSYQGVLLTLHRAFFGRHRPSGALPGPEAELRRTRLDWGLILRRMITIVIFFQIVCYGWLLFRASSMAQVGQFTTSLLHLSPSQFGRLTTPSLPQPTILAILGLILWDLLIERYGATFYAGWSTALRGALYAAMIYLLAFGATTATSAFIYFQF